MSNKTIIRSETIKTYQKPDSYKTKALSTETPHNICTKLIKEEMAVEAPSTFPIFLQDQSLYILY